MLHNMNNWSHNTLLFPILPIKIYPFHFSFYQRLPLKTKQNKTNKNDFSVLVAVCKEMEEKGLSKMSFFFPYHYNADLSSVTYQIPRKGLFF